MPDDLWLAVNGRRYTGWKSARVTRSIESLAGSFDLEVSDRWSESEEPWPIAEEDECRIMIGDKTVIQGYVEDRRHSISGSSISLSYSGFDRTASLVDCSVTGKFSWKKLTILDLAKALCEPFDIKVSLQHEVALSQIAKVSASPGDSVYDVLGKEAKDQGVLLVSDGSGGLRITRAGFDRASPLIEGENVKEASVSYSGRTRYRTYRIVSQAPGTDAAFGSSAHALAESKDLGVRRSSRVLLLRPENGLRAADAKRRADWEARTRAARAERVSVVVQGWSVDGAPWPVNALTNVRIPSLGIDGDMLISQVDHMLGDSTTTQISLVRPDAFSPEPKAITKSPSSKGGVGWKELAGGAR